MSQKKRILIVDDALFMRTMLKRIINGAGEFQIDEAECGSQALTLYEAHRPDLVLLDISMPEMSGIEVLKELRKRDPSAYIIMCSAIGQESMITEAVDCGAADFIVKPFLPDHIIKAVNSIGAEGES